jgi:hypothetical protein
MGNIYQEVTDRIVAELEAGAPPWIRPWSLTPDRNVPHNAVTGRSSQAIHVTAGNHAAPKSQRGLDSYKTPRCAVEPLIAIEPLPSGCWDPCGSDDDTNNIAIALRAYGKTVVATDIASDGIDFRTRREAPPGMTAIVTNPPFSLAAEFVQHGLMLVPKVAILERVQFLESEARAALFDAGMLARVHIFRDRVPRMHREDWDGKRAAPAMVLCWFVFDRDHDGAKPTLDWIRCQGKRP